MKLTAVYSAVILHGNKLNRVVANVHKLSHTPVNEDCFSLFSLNSVFRTKNNGSAVKIILDL